MSKPKPRYKLSPELVDGDHWTVMDTKSQLLEAVGQWCDCQAEMGNENGERFDVEIVYMTDAEVDALPEI